MCLVWERRYELHFNVTTTHHNQREGGDNASIYSSLVPTWPHPRSGFAIAPCRTSPHCSLSLFSFHPGFWLGAQYKSNQARVEVLQFLQLHQVPVDISSTVRRETHHVPSIKYQEAGDDKQLGHTMPTPCKDPQIEGLACHGYHTDAPLSSETPWDIHNPQLQTSRAFFACLYKLSIGSELPSSDSE